MIYVDDLQPCAPTALWHYHQSCHLFTDACLDDLHAFARKIGLRREWFQDKDLPHYDLTARKRAAAIRNGAVEAGRERAVEVMRAWRFRWRPRPRVTARVNGAIVSQLLYHRKQANDD